jgi:succinylglutamate desuccinylase
MNKYAILLSSCVSPFNSKNEADINYRRELYTTQIKSWLSDTNLPIYVVESSGYTFPDIQHDRLKVFSFTMDSGKASSSQYEAISVQYALSHMKQLPEYESYTHIIKVTCRYFLDGIEKVLSEVEQDCDAYLQKHFNPSMSWNNSEYFALRKELMDQFTKRVSHIGLMENELFKFTQNLKYIRIGGFPNTHPRGGDKMVIKSL